MAGLTSHRKPRKFAVVRERWWLPIRVLVFLAGVAAVVNCGVETWKSTSVTTARQDDTAFDKRDRVRAQ